MRLTSILGSDLMLLDLASAAMKAASWPTTVNTGRYTFPVADNTRNAAKVDEVSWALGRLAGVDQSVSQSLMH